MGPDAMSSASGAAMLKIAFPTEALTLTLTDRWATGVVHCHACKTVTNTFSTETNLAREAD